MKRIVCVILTLIMVIGAASCSGGGIPPSVEPGMPTGNENMPPAAEPEGQPGDGATLSEIEPGMQPDDLPRGDTATSATTPGTQPDEGAEAPGSGSEALPDEGAEATDETKAPGEIEVEAPPGFGFIDTHADTITRALLPHNNANLFRNKLHIDFERLHEFGAPVQVFALWCADRYVADAFEYTNSLIDFFESEVAKHSDIIEIALTLEDLERNYRNNKISAILSIEGGEALMGDLENVRHFYDRGVRIMSLTWNRENELGYGQATGSGKGLKPFGIEVLKKMEELEMILDISHINEAGFWDAHRFTTKPYMASHSNAYSVTPHDRNLKDSQIEAMAGRGGIIGLVLYPLLLSQGSSADIGDMIAHVRHFIDIGAGNNLGLGGDLDGFGTMPKGFECVLSFRILEEAIAREYGEETSRRIMSGNTYDFFVRYYRGQ